MSLRRRFRSVLSVVVAMVVTAAALAIPTMATAATSVPALSSLSRVSPDVLVDGDEVVLAWEFDAPVKSVTVQFVDGLGGYRSISSSSWEPAVAGEARAVVDTDSWPGGVVSFSGLSYSFGDDYSSVSLDASGNVTWKSPGLPDVPPAGGVIDVSSFEVDSDMDLSVPPTLTGVSLVSDPVLVDGDEVQIAWTSDAPVQNISFSFLDGMGRWQSAGWSSSQNGYQPATEGVARAVVATASWGGGETALDGIFYSWAGGQINLTATGALASKFPSGLQDPAPFALQPDAVTFTVESDVDLTSVASLLSVDRTSSDVATDGTEVRFEWATDSPVTSVDFLILDGFGRQHLVSWWDQQNSATSGVASAAVDASTWAHGVSKVIQVWLTFPNGSVTMSRDGSLSSKRPSGIDDPAPWPDGFGALDFAVQSDVVFQTVAVPEPMFVDATCDAPAHLRLDDFEHGMWSWSATDGRSGEGDESFDGVPQNLRAGVPFVVSASFDDGWGTQGTARWSHVYTEPEDCDLQPLTAAPVPSISGDAVAGSTLTVDPGTWEPAPVQLSYRWLRDGLAIEGATGPSYTLSPADVGRSISVEVTGTKEGYRSATTASQVVAVIDGPQLETVARWSGADRFATSAAISAAVFEPGVDVAYVASGADFPDALAGAPVAGLRGGPVLLVTRDGVPGAVADELERLKPKRIVVLGGPSVISSTTMSGLHGFTSGDVTRWSGADRFATSAAISAAVFEPGVDVAYVASGADFPDALAGAPVAGLRGGPVLLVTRDGVPGAVADELERLKPKRIVVLGGPSVISSTTMSELATMADIG